MARASTHWLLAGPLALLAVGTAAAQVEQREVPAGQEESRADPKKLPWKEIRAPKGHVDSVAFSRDGTLLAGGAGATVVVWRVEDGKELMRMQLPARQLYHRVTFSADGKTLAWCGREDPLIRLFDVKTGRQLKEYPQPDPRRKLRELARAQGLKVEGFQGRKVEGFSSYFIAFSPDGSRMAFHRPTFFQGVDIFEVATGQRLLSLDRQPDCRGCAFTADGKLLACVSSSGGIHVWDARTGKRVRTLRADEGSPRAAYGFVAFSPDGAYLATAGHTASGIEVWDVHAGKLICKVPHRIYFYTAYFTQDKESILAAGGDGVAALYSLLGEKQTYRFDPPRRQAHFAVFSPGGHKAAIIGPSSDGDSATQLSIYLYDLSEAVLHPAVAHVDDAALEKLWDDLATDNQLRLKRVQAGLRSGPRETVGLLRKKDLPVPKALEKQAEQWITQLDDDDFARRDQATAELRKVVHELGPLLVLRQKEAKAGEMRNRLTFLLSEARDEKDPTSLTRALRAVTLLEQIGTPQALALLREIAQGAPHARLTLAACAALERGKNQLHR